MIQHFSNPNVNFNGVATGVVNERDNARQLREIALDIADYDLGEPPLAPIIQGTTTGDNNTIGSWYVSTNHCANATNYLWETSTNGFNYTVVQNGTSANYSQQLPFNSDLYLRVTVTGLDGDVATAFLTVYNEDSQSCDPCALIGDASQPDIGVKAYPNSVRDHLTINLPMQGQFEKKSRI